MLHVAEGGGKLETHGARPDTHETLPAGSFRSYCISSVKLGAAQVGKIFLS